MSSATTSEPFPSHVDLVAELRLLRRPGLAGLRGTPLPGLERIALARGLCTGPDDLPAGVETLLGEAVRRLGEQDVLGLAAARSFGLVPGSRGAAAQERRKAAALAYGVTAERFRRKQEPQVMEQLAGAVLALCRDMVPAPVARPARVVQAVQVVPTGPTVGPAPVAPPDRLPHDGYDWGPPLRFEPAVSGSRTPFTLHVSPAGLLRDIDILVSSENVYLEMSKTFRPTLSGALRRAAAVRDAAGHIVDDVLARELADWQREHSRPGLPVSPGTVAVTSPGALAAQGIRLVLHAAVATPLADRDGYEVAPESIARAVRASFALARERRDAFDPPLSSICFPLLGAGRGGLPPRTSATWLWWAVREEVARDPDWKVHVVTRRRDVAEAIADL